MSQSAILLQHKGDYDYAILQWRTGKTLRAAADEVGVSRSKLFDYISANNITRDLEQVTRDMRESLLASDVIDVNGKMPTSREEIIAINATLQAALIRQHRQDIERFRRLAMMLLTELEGQTNFSDVFEDLGTLLRSPDDKGSDRLNDAYQKVISLPGRTDTLKKLGDTLKIIVTLERQAFGMRDDYEDEEIRRAKLAGSEKQQAITSDFEVITRKFMKVLGSNQEITDVQPSGSSQAVNP